MLDSNNALLAQLRGLWVKTVNDPNNQQPQRATHTAPSAAHDPRIEKLMSVANQISDKTTVIERLTTHIWQERVRELACL